MDTRRLRRGAVPAVALSLALTLTGCSGSSGSSGSSSGGSGSATSAAGGVASLAAGGSSASPSASGGTGTVPGHGAGSSVTYGDIPNIVSDVEPAVVTLTVTKQQGTALGSGVIWKSSGVIITNNHVIAGAQGITVAFADGTQVKAKVIATDPVTDIAIVQANRDNLPTAQFDTSEPPVGTLAVAIGSPLGFTESVTAGIVSGLNREIPGGGSALVNLIQTDAPISPGNSGGALVGPDAKVIGINDAYLPPGKTGAVAIGFAIPAQTALDIARTLLNKGTVSHPYLGVALQPLTQQIAQQLNVSVSSGAVVVNVQSGGPAAKAGIQPGDVITSLAGSRIQDVQDVYAALRSHKPGDQVQVTVHRSGQAKQLQLTLGNRPDNLGQSSGGQSGG